ncbi:hypothetical protein IC617_08965 [Neiella sp. HB171785]|uniref:Uncharacterized protein n=1 Tax=Neiella litorisoli TaxID=2771431 RepID=A0A8J6QIT2_9GAMM|nr:hypothetical protein [Neiella litorisoli]MBD1389558.1 hypothetical protein [Neiella litorisoli]
MLEGKDITWRSADEIIRTGEALSADAVEVLYDKLNSCVNPSQLEEAQAENDELQEKVEELEDDVYQLQQQLKNAPANSGHASVPIDVLEQLLALVSDKLEDSLESRSIVITINEAIRQTQRGH